MQFNALPGPVRRALRGAVIIVVLMGVMLFGFPGQARHFMQLLSGETEEPDPVTVYPYNFTGYGIEYVVSPGLLGYLPAGAADGRTVLKDAYVPAPQDKGAVPVRWRYVTGEYADKPRDHYDFGATLKLPARPSKDAVLTIRFYPGGGAAARYTTHPETAASGSVDTTLAGSGWVGNPQP
jgi:hypothetical protein